jgi:crossover junction endodeoxyribonuclease RuvC
MLVLGIDPGSTATGYGLVTRQRGRYRMIAAGAIKTKSKDPIPQRLQEIYDGLCAIIQLHRPEVVAIEAIFRHKSSESALRLGQARGVALLAGAGADCPIFEYNAMTVKKSVTGSGRADKDQVRHMVGMLTGADMSALNADATDAVAIAITHLAHAAHHAAQGSRR